MGIRSSFEISEILNKPNDFNGNSNTAQQAVEIPTDSICLDEILPQPNNEFLNQHQEYDEEDFPENRVAIPYMELNRKAKDTLIVTNDILGQAEWSAEYCGEAQPQQDHPPKECRPPQEYGKRCWHKSQTGHWSELCVICDSA